MPIVFGFHDRATEIDYPAELRQDVELLLKIPGAVNGRPNHRLTIEPEGNRRYALSLDGTDVAKHLSREQSLSRLLEELVRSLIVDLDSAVALHAGAVAWRGRSILLPGPSGSGKSALVAWLIDNGFRYLSDEVVAVTESGELALARPLLLKSGAAAKVAELDSMRRNPLLALGSELAVCPDARSNGNKPLSSALMLFPRFVESGELEMIPLSTAQAGLKLMESNLNARNLTDFGFPALSALARRVPAIELRYGDYGQLRGVLDVLVRFLLHSDPGGVQQLLAAFRSRNPFHDEVRQSAAAASPVPKPRSAIPAPTPRRAAKKLTVGMATYDDYDGVYFTLQALRMYHSEVLDEMEFVVIDNHPDGACADPLKKLENDIPNYRYVPKFDRQGTAIRDSVFEEASGEFVLCVDCHVLIVKDAVKRLLDYFQAHPSTKDLLQGPLLSNNQTGVVTHLIPKWRAGMFGIWATSAEGVEVDLPPFEVTMHGLGLFACRRAAWPGFNPAFRGFGGEEGYIHEKFRRRGGRALCLPFLRWMHRFDRPGGTPYVNRWEDRIRNYFIGFRELGWDTAPVIAHFEEVLGKGPTDQIVSSLKWELASPEGMQADENHTTGCSASVGALRSPAEPARPEEERLAFASVWDQPSLTQQRALLQRVSTIAESRNIALFLYWGTLLGHVRDGGILPWDDDVDLAMFEWKGTAELRQAFEAAGLAVHDKRTPSETWLKVYDPTYPVTPRPNLPWTWPCIDIFIYAEQGEITDGFCPVSPIPRDLILPGRITTFEGVRCWEPEQPCAVLDRQYADWRRCEQTSRYSHRREQSNARWATRQIVTDAQGCKIADGDFRPEQRENPLSRGVFVPLLRRWIDLCRQHGIRYSIFWGTLLGQLRDRRFIPYDRDLDVVVGRSGLDALYALPGRVPGCVFNDALKDQPAWKEHEIRLVVRRDLVSPDGPRYDHRGQVALTQVDSCAFNGPLARLIIKVPAAVDERSYWHLDVDLFTDISHFNPYPAVHEVDELPELEDRPLEDLQVSCLKDPLPYILAWYGTDYMAPDHIYHDGRWVRRT